MLVSSLRFIDDLADQEQREGLTIHNVTYDGRDLFYRLSLSEMFVPYGDSRSPYPRKAAFDLGNNGAGVNANNLQLGKSIIFVDDLPIFH